MFKKKDVVKTGPNSFYWESSCKEEKRQLAEAMKWYNGDYNQFIMNWPDDCVIPDITWEDYYKRLRRVRSLYLQNKGQVTYEELYKRYMEPLP